MKMVKVWSDAKGWCVQVEGNEAIYIYQTMRSALKMVESLLKGASKEE